MMSKSFLLILWAAATAEAFVVIVTHHSTLKGTGTSAVSLEGTVTNLNSFSDDVLDELQHEYKMLQERLWRDIVVTHDGEDAEMTEEQMIEIAAKATRIHEDKQINVMEEAENTRAQAKEARKRVKSLKKEAHKKEKAPVIDIAEMDAIYDELVAYSDFRELEATHKIQAAKILLLELQENEKRLQVSLETLKKLYHPDGKEKRIALKEELHTRHRSFLDTVQDAIRAHPDILISLDPHIL